jgi:N-glycosylase/DNA lyase
MLPCNADNHFDGAKLNSMTKIFGLALLVNIYKSDPYIIAGSTVFGLKEQDNDLHFTTFPPTENQKPDHDLLNKYFLLDLSLGKLMKEWSDADPNFKKLASTGKFDGLRLLQIDPVECLFCFICSQNNNIKRITKMVENLCSTYGKLLQTVNDIPIYQFPTVHDLATKADEDKLRSLGIVLFLDRW